MIHLTPYNAPQVINHQDPIFQFYLTQCPQPAPNYMPLISEQTSLIILYLSGCSSFLPSKGEPSLSCALSTNSSCPCLARLLNFLSFSLLGVSSPAFCATFFNSLLTQMTEPISPSVTRLHDCVTVYQPPRDSLHNLEDLHWVAHSFDFLLAELKNSHSTLR